ncbi:MAG: FAD-dependent oxidoreductase [Nocardioidaceae bacterium]
MTTTLKVPVVIVGAGPAGLRAAQELAPQVDGEVLVLDREGQLGGIPRHSHHQGYGLRDLGRSLTGPAYARRLVTAAAAAGAHLRSRAMVTGWAGERALEVTSPEGRQVVSADAVVLATGARERARAARWIPGDRPGGVLTTGELQQLVHLEGLPVGGRAVVVGAELVSWSAVLTLRQAGVETVCLVTEHPQPDSYRAFSAPGRLLFRTRVRTSSRVVRVVGRGRVSGVEVEDVATGAREIVACDTVVFTGDWVPDHEIARLGGVPLDAGTLGPRVDAALRTEVPGVFAAGNVLHAVDTADVCALDGAHVARSVLAHLHGARPAAAAVRVVADAPFRWVAPSLLRPGDTAPARERLLLWTDELVRRPRVVARQDGRVVGSLRVRWPAAPGRVFRVPSSLLADVRWDGGEVRVGLG